MVVFRKAQKDITGLKITGVRISDSEGWRKGQSFNVQVLNMPPEGQITVTAYEGLTGWQRSDAWNVSMEEGKISKIRYDNYVNIYTELKEKRKW